jgi:hypothetical protein
VRVRSQVEQVLVRLHVRLVRCTHLPRPFPSLAGEPGQFFGRIASTPGQ